MEFVRSVWTGPPDNDILCVFKATPIGILDWPPTLSGKITFSIDNRKDSTMSITVPENNITVVLDDKNIRARDRQIYEYIKYKAGDISGDDLLLISFFFHHRGKKKPHRMSITYGLCDKYNQSACDEKKYDFVVE